MELLKPDGVLARNKLISILEDLRVTVADLSFFSARVLVVTEYEVINSVSESISVEVLVFVNNKVFFKDNFITLALTWPDARDHIFLISCMGERVTLKGFSMESSPAMTFPSLSLLGRVMCLGKTIILSLSNF